MTAEEFKTVQAWFERNVEMHMNINSGIREILLPRLVHCGHVSDNCRALAEDLHLQPGGQMTAAAVGLLHDTGRFSQYAEFGSFIDKETVSHSERGYEIAEKSPVLLSLSPCDRQKILDGIRYHTSKDFAARAHPESIDYIKLLRDADRIDRFRITLELIQHDSAARKLSVRSDGPVNPKVTDRICNHKSASKKIIGSTLDFYLFRLSSVFDIAFGVTYKRVSESGIVGEIVTYFPEHEGIGAAVECMMAYLKMKRK